MPGLKIKIDVNEAERASRQLRKEMTALGLEAVKDEKEFKKLEDRLHKGMESDKAKKGIDGLQKSLNLTRLETAKLQAKVGDYSGAVKTMVSGNDGAAKSFSNLKTMIGAAAAAFGAYKIAGFVKEIAMAGARYETLGIVMNNVGKNAGYSAAQMAEYAKGVRESGIQMDTSREVVIKLAQAQIDLNSATMLARVAQDAAVIGNINSSEALERLVYGIQSAQTDVLKTIGINVSFENSYKKMAAQLGKNANALTEEEKVQARVNVVKEAGAKIVGTYGAAMETAGKKITSLPRYLAEFKIQMGEAFNPATADAVQAVTDTMKMLNEEIVKPENQQALAEISQGFADWVVANNDLLKQNMPEYIRDIGSSISGLKGIYDSLPDGVVGAAGVGILGSILTGSITIGAFAASVKLLGDGLKNVYNPDINGASALSSTSVEIVQKSIEGLEESLKKLNATGAEAHPWMFSDDKLNKISDAKALLDQLKNRLIYLQDIEFDVDFGSFNDGLEGSTGKIKAVDSSLTSLTKKASAEIAKISDEYAKLTMSANDYERLSLGVWFKKESEAIGGTTKELQRLYDLKLKMIPTTEDMIDLQKRLAFAMEDTYDIDYGTAEENFKALLKSEEEESEKFFADQKKAWEDQQKATEKAQKEQEDSYKHMFDNIHDINASMWRDFMDGGDNAFDIILDKAKDVFAEILATWSTQIMMNVAFGSSGMGSGGGIVGSLTGGGGIGLGNIASLGQSAWGAFSGGTSSATYSALTGLGMAEAVPVSTGALAAGGELGWGASNMAALGSGTGTSLAGGIAMAAPYLALAAGAAMLISKLTAWEPTPAIGVGGGKWDAESPGEGLWNSKKFNFRTFDQDMGGNISEVFRDYFDNRFTLVDEALNGALADTLMKANAGAANNGWIMTEGMEADQMLKAVSDNIFVSILDTLREQTVGLGYEDFGLDFFKSIAGEGEDLFQAFVNFNAVVQETPDFLVKLTRQMEQFWETTLDAFTNLQTISTMTAMFDLTDMTDEERAIKSVNDQFDAYVAVLTDANAELGLLTRAEELRNKELEKATQISRDAALSAAEQNVRKAYASESERLSALFSALSGYVDELRNAREGMALVGNEFPDFKRAIVEVSDALSLARSGDFSGLDGLSKSIEASADVPIGQYGSSEDYQRAYWESYNQLAELEALTGDQVSIEEQQISKMDEQLNALFGIDESVMSVKDATDALVAIQMAIAQDQLEAKSQALARAEAAVRVSEEAAAARLESYRTNIPTTYISGQTNNPYWEKVLGNFNQDHTAAYGIPMNRGWGTDADAQRSYGSLSKQYLASIPASAMGNIFSMGDITPFARGDIFDSPHMFPMANGMGLMAEDGPEAIMPLTRIGGSLGVRAEGNNSNLIAEVRALRAEVKALRSESRAGTFQVVKNTGKTAKILSRFDDNGLPAERTA